MKSAANLLLILLVVFTASYSEGASIYSFEGTISSLYYDGAGIIADTAFKVGDPVNAKFYVDFQKNGYFLLNNGEIYIPENPPMTNNPYWYFHSTLMSGTLLPEINGGSNNGPTDIAEYHIGHYNSGPMGNRGALQGGTGDSNLTVWEEGYNDTRVQNWVIGENLKGTIVGWSDQDWSIMLADLRLVDIQPDSEPVPEPSTFILLIIGLVSILCLRRKFNMPTTKVSVLKPRI